MSVNVSEDEYYKQPRFGNPRSFAEQFKRMRVRFEVKSLYELEEQILRQYELPLIAKIEETFKPSFEEEILLGLNDQILTDNEGEGYSLNIRQEAQPKTYTISIGKGHRLSAGFSD